MEKRFIYIGLILFIVMYTFSNSIEFITGNQIVPVVNKIKGPLPNMLDPEGTNYVTFVDIQNSPPKVMVAHNVGEDTLSNRNTYCSNRGWICETVFQHLNLDYYALAITLPTPNDPKLIFATGGTPGGELHFAERNRVTGAWTDDVLDTGHKFYFSDPSLTVDDNGNPIFVYSKETLMTNYEIKLARYVGNGQGNAGSNLQWSIQTIDVNFVSAGFFPSILIDGQGKVHILYSRYDNALRRYLVNYIHETTSSGSCTNPQFNCHTFTNILYGSGLFGGLHQLESSQTAIGFSHGVSSLSPPLASTSLTAFQARNPQNPITLPIHDGQSPSRISSILDKQNRIHIYYDHIKRNGEIFINHAYQVSPGRGNCGDPLTRDWQCDQEVSMQNNHYFDILISDSTNNNKKYVIYHEYDATLNNPKDLIRYYTYDNNGRPMHPLTLHAIPGQGSTAIFSLSADFY